MLRDTNVFLCSLSGGKREEGSSDFRLTVDSFIGKLIKVKVKQLLIVLWSELCDLSL